MNRQLFNYTSIFHLRFLLLIISDLCLKENVKLLLSTVTAINEQSVMARERIMCPNGTRGRVLIDASDRHSTDKLTECS